MTEAEVNKDKTGRNKLQEQEKRREELQNEIEELKRQQYLDDMNQDDRRWFVNRYENQLEDARCYYQGHEANVKFESMSDDMEEQRRTIIKESNLQFEREEKISRLRRMREEV